jgi:hypothetical protein
MEIIIMKSGTCRELMGRLAAIEEYVSAQRPQAPRMPTTEELWLDNATVCAYLKISRRTLQRYRSNGTIVYSMIGHKAYYKISEVKRLLEMHVKRGSGSGPLSEE